MSYKYTADWKFLNVDTLWPKPKLGIKWEPETVCNINKERVLSVKKIDTLSWVDCPPPNPLRPEFRREILVYNY